MDQWQYGPPTPERLVRPRSPLARTSRRKQQRPRKRGPDGHWVLDRVQQTTKGKDIYFYKWWEPIVWGDGSWGWMLDQSQDEPLPYDAADPDDDGRNWMVWG